MFAFVHFFSETPLLCFEKVIRLSREIIVFRVIGDLLVNQGFIFDGSHAFAPFQAKNRPRVSCYASFSDWLIYLIYQKC